MQNHVNVWLSVIFPVSVSFKHTLTWSSKMNSPPSAMGKNSSFLITLNAAWAAVLAANGFDSGKQRWHVDVGLQQRVVRWGGTRVNKEEDCSFSQPKRGFLGNFKQWGILLVSDLSPHSTNPENPPPQIITVELDHDKGKVSFSDAVDGGSIYTFKDRFTERIFPYFATGIKEGSTLRISAF